MLSTPLSVSFSARSLRQIAGNLRSWSLWWTLWRGLLVLVHLCRTLIFQSKSNHAEKLLSWPVCELFKDPHNSPKGKCMSIILSLPGWVHEHWRCTGMLRKVSKWEMVWTMARKFVIWCVGLLVNPKWHVFGMNFKHKNGWGTWTCIGACFWLTELLPTDPPSNLNLRVAFPPMLKSKDLLYCGELEDPNRLVLINHQFENKMTIYIYITLIYHIVVGITPNK